MKAQVDLLKGIIEAEKKMNDELNSISTMQKDNLLLAMSSGRNLNYNDSFVEPQNKTIQEEKPKSRLNIDINENISQFGSRMTIS